MIPPPLQVIQVWSALQGRFTYRLLDGLNTYRGGSFDSANEARAYALALLEGREP